MLPIQLPSEDDEASKRKEGLEGTFRLRPVMQSCPVEGGLRRDQENEDRYSDEHKSGKSRCGRLQHQAIIDPAARYIRSAT